MFGLSSGYLLVHCKYTGYGNVAPEPLIDIVLLLPQDIKTIPVTNIVNIDNINFFIISPFNIHF
jgi:hypothetical protein